MKTNTKTIFDEMRADVASGEMVPSGYVEQCWIARVTGEISHDEFMELTNTIPFCPALVDGFVK